MDDLIAASIASLRESQRALESEVRTLLETRYLDRAMLMRLRDVADEFAQHARHLRQRMTVPSADDDALDEVDQLCKYFENVADLISRRVSYTGAAAYRLTKGKVGKG